MASPAPPPASGTPPVAAPAGPAPGVVYDGPVLDLPPGDLRTRFLDHFADPLRQVGRTVSEVFPLWRVVVRYRGANSYDAIYYTESGKRLPSRPQVLRHFGLSEEQDPLILLASLNAKFVPGTKGLKPGEDETMANGSEAPSPILNGQEFSLDGKEPGPARTKIIQHHRSEAARLIIRLVRTDVNLFYVGADLNGPDNRPFTLNNVKVKLESNEYVQRGRLAFFKWDEFSRDLVKVFESDPVDATVQPELMRVAHEACRDIMTKARSEMEQCRKEEATLWVGENRAQPTMASWHKELMSEYKYKYIESYIPAAGLLPEEVDALMRKLEVQDEDKSNRWIFDEGLRNLDAWAEVVAFDLRVGERSWKGLNQLGPNKDIEEQHTWGMDCFVRSNIKLAISQVSDPDLRLSKQQTHYFVERLLMREINHVRPIELGYNIRNALENLLAKCEQGIFARERPAEPAHPTNAAGAAASGSSPEDLTGRRIKIYWPLDKAWYSGTIIGMTKRKHEVVVEYDDGTIENENLSKHKYTLLGSGELLFDPYMSQAQLIAATRAILEALELYGEEVFAVHSKGLGVITQRELTAGEMLGQYLGHLYPAWLWEQKEQAEDDARRRDKRKGRAALPDFWNIRLEVPKDTKGGFDLMHVDAKHAGNFTSRMSHSCRPNCGAITAVIDGKFCVALRALRNIEVGEELCIDYNCITDSIDEYRAATCLCGAHDCRGSFLLVSGEVNQSLIAEKYHTPLHRVALLMRASFACGEIERAFWPDGFTESWPKWVRTAVREKSPAAAAAASTKNIQVGAKVEADGRTGVTMSEMGHGGYIKIKWDDTNQISNKRRRDITLLGDPFEDDEDEDLEEQSAMQVISDYLSRHGLGSRALHLIPQWALRFAAYALAYAEDEAYDLPRVQLHNEAPSKDAKKQPPEERLHMLDLEAKGLQFQRMTNLIIALDKARHHMCTRLTNNNPPSLPTFAASSSSDSVAPAPAVASSTTTSASASSSGSSVLRLRERWWIGDRCLARWVGDDSDQYPDWYPATVTHVNVSSNELFVAYDSAEVNKIPTNMARRPTLTEKFPPPRTALSVQYHQAPFRVLDGLEIAERLWTDPDTGVAARLVRALRQVYSKPFTAWQLALDRKTHKPYWWNFITREMSLERPAPVFFEEKTVFMPKLLDDMEALLASKHPKDCIAVQKCLIELRDMVLALPTVGNARWLDDHHQKAADLLTLLSMTSNFFVLSEPEAPKHGYTTSMDTRGGKRLKWADEAQAQHHVISALTSWTGQGEARCPEITSMVGGAVIPPIESAYDPDCALGYSAGARAALLKHMQMPQTRMSDWPSVVIDAFPGASLPPPTPPSLAQRWPPPCPPIRLCGSPMLDAALQELIDHERAVALLREKKKLDINPVPDTRDRSSAFIRQVVEALRKHKRDIGKIDPRDAVRAMPPPLPDIVQITWVQCDSCHKWRRLPRQSDLARFESGFVCSQLAKSDPEHATCSAREQTEEEIIVQSYTPNLDYVTVGTFVDTYSNTDMMWVVSSVIEVNSEAIHTKRLGAPAEDKGEWHLKLPSHGESMTVLPVYTMTEKDVMGKPDKVPYTHLVPDGVDVPPDVARCVRGLVDKVHSMARQERERLARQQQKARKDGSAPAEQRLILGYREPVQPVLAKSLTATQRQALMAFIDAERTVDPNVPFAHVFARWAVMDDAQRALWERLKDKRHTHGEAYLPSVTRGGTCPLLLVPQQPRVEGMERRTVAVQVLPVLVNETPPPELASEGGTTVSTANHASNSSGGTATNLLFPCSTPYGIGVVTGTDPLFGSIVVKLGWGTAYLPHASNEVFARFVQVAPAFNQALSTSASVAKRAFPAPPLTSRLSTGNSKRPKVEEVSDPYATEPVSLNLNVNYEGASAALQRWLATRKHQWIRRVWAFRGNRVFVPEDPDVA